MSQLENVRMNTFILLYFTYIKINDNSFQLQSFKILPPGKFIMKFFIECTEDGGLFKL